MTRHFFLSLLATTTVWVATLPAQTILNNYYNAPSYLTPGGLPGETFPSFQAPVQRFGSNTGVSSVPTSLGSPTLAPINYTSAPLTTTTVSNPLTGIPTTVSPLTSPLSTTSPYTTSPVATYTPVTSTSGALVQQIYPQPAVATTTNLTTGYPTTYTTETTAQQYAPLQIPQLPLQYVAPPEALIPGLLTIKNSKWTITDFFYNLSPYIGVKVEVVKPQGKYIPLSDNLLEARVKDILREASITTDALDIPCQPPSPMLYVLVMAYPCDRRCVGFVTAQLLEIANPKRMEDVAEINGIWQVVTWERTALVASACDDFAQEVGETIDQFIRSFSDTYKYYHPIDEQPCFDVGVDP